MYFITCSSKTCSTCDESQVHSSNLQSNRSHMLYLSPSCTHNTYFQLLSVSLCCSLGSCTPWLAIMCDFAHYVDNLWAQGNCQLPQNLKVLASKTKFEDLVSPKIPHTQMYIHKQTHTYACGWMVGVHVYSTLWMCTWNMRSCACNQSTRLANVHKMLYLPSSWRCFCCWSLNEASTVDVIVSMDTSYDNQHSGGKFEWKFNHVQFPPFVIAHICSKACFHILLQIFLIYKSFITYMIERRHVWVHLEIWYKYWLSM